MGKQEQVSIFMNQYGLNIKPEYRALDIAAEFGEVASEMLATSGYGDEPITANRDLEEEIGDLYFSLIALANTLNIDLDMALEDVLDKYEQRITEAATPSSPETREDQSAQPERHDFAPDQTEDVSTGRETGKPAPETSEDGNDGAEETSDPSQEQPVTSGTDDTEETPDRQADRGPHQGAPMEPEQRKVEPSSGDEDTELMDEIDLGDLQED